MNKPEDQIWEEFWKGIVCRSDGSIDIEEVKKELYDYYILLDNVPKVYDHITGGVISKPNTDAGVVISIADDRVNQIVDDNLSWSGFQPFNES